MERFSNATEIHLMRENTDNCMSLGQIADDSSLNASESVRDTLWIQCFEVQWTKNFIYTYWLIVYAGQLQVSSPG